MHTSRDMEIARETETDQESDTREPSLEGARASCVSESILKEEPTKVDSSPLPSRHRADRTKHYYQLNVNIVRG